MRQQLHPVMIDQHEKKIPGGLAQLHALGELAQQRFLYLAADRRIREQIPQVARFLISRGDIRQFAANPGGVVRQSHVG
jgi:hypothetical protein